MFLTSTIASEFRQYSEPNRPNGNQIEYVKEQKNVQTKIGINVDESKCANAKKYDQSKNDG